MATLAEQLAELAESTAFSGVVRVDRGGEALLERAWGLADRRWQIPNDVDTRFGTASGTKGFTALTVLSLVEDGTLALDTPARSVLGGDLPLIGDDVTVEHLLAHRSGIGDYYDEEVIEDFDAFELPVSVHSLAATEDYLRVLDGFPTKFPPDERFSYSNGGYVVLALLAERASGIPFHELVVQRVCRPAGMHDTGFFRSDDLPARTAVGYLEDGTTNVFKLPVRGSGDGGLYTTAADVRALWSALFGGRLLPLARVEEAVRPRSESGSLRCGLGFWLDPDRGLVRLHGMDAGVSFSTTHDRARDETTTVLANTADGAWPLARMLAGAGTAARASILEAAPDL